MHICSIITSFTSGGAETLVCNLSDEFVANGHQATVLALCDAANLGNSAETEQAMMSRLRGRGIRAASLGLSQRRSILGGRRALGEALRSCAVDVIHAHTARAAPMVGLGPSEVPLVLTHHNSRLSFPPRLFRIFDCFVDAYVGISAACAEQTSRYARRPVRTIANGAQSDRTVDQHRGATCAQPTIIAVGAVSDQKDYPTLVAAAKRLRPLLQRAGKTFTLQIVGGGEGLKAIRDLANADGLQTQVQLLGVRSDVPALLRSADLFVNSSRYEGMSVAMIEALMAALPVVATDVPGNCELLQSGYNGLLVSPADPEALAGAIARVLLSPELYEHFSQGALASSTTYSIEQCARSHLQLYEELIVARCAALRAA